LTEKEEEQLTSFVLCKDGGYGFWACPLWQGSGKKDGAAGRAWFDGLDQAEILNSLYISHNHFPMCHLT